MFDHISRDTQERQRLTGIILPYRDKFIALHPNAELIAPQIKLYTEKRYGIAKYDFIEHNENTYVLTDPMDYGDFGELCTFIGTLVEGDPY